MTTSAGKAPSIDQPPGAVSVEVRIERLRATCAGLDDDLVSLTLVAPSRRSPRLLQDMQARLQQFQPATAGPRTPPPPSWTPAAPTAVVDVTFPDTSPVTVATHTAPRGDVGADAAVPQSLAPQSLASQALASQAAPLAASTPAFTVLVGDAPPAGIAATTAPAKKATREKAPHPSTPAGRQAPSLRPGALLHGLLTALAAAATATPLTLGLALTTTLTALIAGVSRGLWSRLTQLLGLGTIASVVAALWPIGERLSWRRPVGEDELLLALPQALVALQALRLVWKARGRAATAHPALATPAPGSPPQRRGLIGLAVGVVAAVALDFALLLLAMGPVWAWLWRSSRGWLAVALLVVGIVDAVRGRRGVTGVIAIGVVVALAVVLGVGAWNLRTAMFHDILSLARVAIAVVVGALALGLAARVVRRRRAPIGGPP